MGNGGGGFKCFLGNPRVLDSLLLFSDDSSSVWLGLLLSSCVGGFSTSITLIGVVNVSIGVADTSADPLEADTGFEGPVPYGGTPPGGTVKFDLRRDL